MYAIVEIAGQQFKVAKDQKVFVHRLATEEGESISFHNVLLLDDAGKITIGAPAIDGAAVEAKVVKHLKGDKVIVFKKKRRKGYRKKNGHRQSLTEIIIESILASGAKKSETKAKTEKAAPKKEAKPVAKKEEAKAPAKKATPKKETKPKAEAKTESKKEESKAKAETKAKKPAAKKSAKADDLKLIEGAGPKAAEALVNAGVDTFAKLAKKSPEQISEILAEASSRLTHLVTDTWPKQAKLAAEGKWDELKEYQEKLDGGIEK